MPNPNIVAIVGANGFIGSALSAFLTKKGFRIASYSSSKPLFTGNQLSSEISQAKFVIWCASRVNPFSASTSPSLVEFEIKEWGAFLDAIEKLDGDKPRIIFLSSGGCTYTSNVLPFREDSEALGVNDYGVLKIKMENDLLSRVIPATILRVSNVYGRNQPHGRGQGVIAEWIHAIRTDGIIKVYGSLDSFRDYLHIEDLCAGIAQLLRIDLPQSIYNLGSGVASTLRDVLTIFTGQNPKLIDIQIGNERATDRTGYYLEVNLFKNETNWKPKYSLNSGITEILKESDVSQNG